MSNSVNEKNADVACSAGADWAERLNEQYNDWRNKTVEGVIQLGKNLLTAKKDIGHGRFSRWCDEHLEFGRRAAQTFMRIAAWAESNAQHAALLPPDWTAIDHITRLDDETLTEWVADGTIHPNARREDIKHKIKQKQRLEKHQQIAAEGRFAAMTNAKAGQFAVIYADPPWQFETWSEKGKDLTSPDNHYPTMSYEEIAAIEVDGYRVSEIAAKDAACFMWCTSSNILRAAEIMEAWGFQYKSQRIWDKQRTGTGYIFLNQHEVLLYGTRGNAPTPMEKFSSVLSAPRGKHSEKPAAVREMIELMFPHGDEHSRIEMFYRGEQIPGWSVWGLEAVEAAA